MNGHPKFDLADVELQFQFAHYTWAKKNFEDRFLQEWSISANWLDENGKPLEEVGTASIIIVDLGEAWGAGVHPYEVCDAASADLETIAAVIFDSSTGELTPELEKKLNFPGGAMLVLDRVRIVPAFRGQGAGVLVAALAIDTLSRGCSFAVCYPAPFEDEDRANFDHRQKELEKIWSRIGFELFRGGVWVLDLTEITFGRLLQERLDRVFPSLGDA